MTQMQAEVVATAERFPHVEPKVRELIAQHLTIPDEPLRLAIYYAPDRDPQDVFLFEVIDGFGRNEVGEGRELFEVTYQSRPNFPVAPGQLLHLVLCNPFEARAAFEQGWAAAQEIRRAVDRGDYCIVYEAPGAADLLEAVRGR